MSAEGDLLALAEKMPVQPWIVAVNGYGEGTYYTRSRGKALAEAWRSDAFLGLSFGAFLKIATAYGGVGHECFGDHITVGGKPARMISRNRQYIQFVYPDSDVILNSHPLDVDPPEARRGTPYYSAAPEPPPSTRKDE